MNENQIPQFHGGLNPVGQLPRVGTPMADRKQSSGIMKVLRAHMRSPSKPKTGQKKGVRSGGKKTIAKDMTAHFKHNRKFF